MTGETMGDRYPRLMELPGFEAMAASPARDFEAIAAEPPGFDGGRHRELRLLVLGCDYRGGPLLCGCTKTRICLAGKGRPVPGTDAFDVTDEDCMDCVKN